MSREHQTSTLMNQVDTSPLRDLQTAGWTCVGLVVVGDLVRFRILQLLHVPDTSHRMSPSPVCGHLSDPVVLVHPRRLIRVSSISLRLLSSLVALLEWSSLAMSS